MSIEPALTKKEQEQFVLQAVVVLEEVRKDRLKFYDIQHRIYEMEQDESVGRSEDNPGRNDGRDRASQILRNLQVFSRAGGSVFDPRIRRCPTRLKSTFRITLRSGLEPYLV